MSDVKTIKLDDGEETAVKFPYSYPYYFITNMGDGDIYASGNPGIAPYADGVYAVPPGTEIRISPKRSGDTVYLLGSGRVQIRAEEIAVQTSFRRTQKGGDVKLNGLVEHTTGSAGWKIDINGSAIAEKEHEHNITYYSVAENLTIYIKAEDNSNECKFIWSTIADVKTVHPNPYLIGTPVTDAVNGIVTVPKGAKYICFSQRIDDTETGVYKLS